MSYLLHSGVNGSLSNGSSDVCRHVSSPDKVHYSSVCACVLCVSTRGHAHIHTRVLTHTGIHTQHTCMHSCRHMHASATRSIHTHVHLHTHTCGRTHTYSHTTTHKHTYTHAQFIAHMIWCTGQVLGISRGHPRGVCSISKWQCIC